MASWLAGEPSGQVLYDGPVVLSDLGARGTSHGLLWHSIVFWAAGAISLSSVLIMQCFLFWCWFELSFSYVACQEFISSAFLQVGIGS